MTLTTFIKLSILGSVVFTASCSELPKEQADTAFINGKVFTAHDDIIVEAFAIKGKNIIYAGSSEKVQKLVGQDTKIINLSGKVVLPGLIDTHIHPIAAMDVSICDLENKPLSLEDMTTFVSACLDNLPEPLPKGEWLQVELWNFIEGNTVSENKKTIRDALDAVSTKRPIILLGSDGHHYGVNSAALALGQTDNGHVIGLNASNLKSEYEKLIPYVGIGADGRLNGRINEDYPLYALGASSLLGATNERHRLYSERMMDVTLPRGITGFLDAAAAPSSLDIFDKLIADNALKARISLALFFDPNGHKNDDGNVDWTEIFSQANSIRNKYAKVEYIKADFMKIFIDGVIEGDPLANPPTLPNAAFSRPYLQPVFSIDAASGIPKLDSYADPDATDCEIRHPGQCIFSSGKLQNEKEILTDFIVKADQNDYTLLLHAIGDRAVSTALDGIEQAQDLGSERRHILTHLQVVEPADIERIAKTNSYASFTFAWAVRDPGYDMTVIPFIDRSDDAEGLYDSEGYYYQNVYPAGDIVRAGGVVLSGSDAPVDTRDPRPFVNMAGAVARSFDETLPLNIDQAISLENALNSYTINAAKALHIDELAGSIETGKRADFIILDRDIFSLTIPMQTSELA